MATMRSSRAAWQEYVRWNEVIADVVFPELDVPTPVYLDIEADRVERIGEALNIDADSVVDILVQVVRQTVDVESYTGAFDQHLRRVQVWKERERANTYPVLATLAVFSLAAERMAAADGMSSANYYGRLADLLDGPKENLSRGYAQVAEPLWSGLNIWLTTLNGRRGLPSAYALGKRYVGLPMSQALVREADRRKLERFFADFDFAPRSEIPAPELVPLLNAWFAKEHQLSHMGRLWKRPALQERIAEVAAVELQAWDGVDESAEDGGQARGRTLLALQLRSFPKPDVRLFPFFFVAEPDTPRKAQLAAVGGAVELTLEPALELQGAMAFSDRGAVEASSLLEGIMHVQDSLGSDVTRAPRALVVFRKDDYSALWLETKQVLMGDDVVVLSSDRTLSAVRELLNEIARPGWSEVSEREGLPAGWTLFQGVEIFARPRESGLKQDFDALVPLTSSQLRLSGGLALPGATRNRWHARRPPEIRAVYDGGEFSVRLIDLALDGENDERVIDQWDDGGCGSVLVDLTDAELDDGSYAIEMVAGKAVMARREFSLHASDNVDELAWSRVETIQHALGDPLAALGASKSESGGPIVQGAFLVDPNEPGAADRPASSPPPERAWWRPKRDETRTRAVSLTKPNPRSCFYTGAHHLELPPAMSDNAKQQVTGVCKYCGMQKRYSASYYRNRAKHQRRQEREASIPTIDVKKLPPLDSHGISASGDAWEVALDALRYLGGGPISTLERVARQVDPSSIFVSDFIETLEALGHIEVRRSVATLQPEAWEMAPTAIIETRADRALVGFWTPGLVEVLRGQAQAHGRIVVEEPSDQGPARTSTDATTAEFEEWLDIDGAVVAGRVGRALADRLPPLSAVVRALPRVPAPSFTEVQWFDPSQAAWTETFGIDAVGAYRVGRYSAAHYIRTEDDLSRGTMARATVYLAKHFAAGTLAGRPMLAYSARSEGLAVPLGALLPGLYQRAVVLDSGTPPRRVRQNHVYYSVSPEVAARITYLLES